MTIVLLALLGVAHAHDGEDHSVAAPVSAAASDNRLPTWSSEFDAVVRLPAHPEPGAPLDGALLLADAGTSAPISGGTAKLVFDGTTPAEATFHPGDSPGLWPFTVTLPDAGPWRGALTVVADRRSDALGLPEWSFPGAASAADPGAPWGWGLALFAGGAALLGVGYTLGRSRGAAAAAGLIALVVTSRVQAHNGEDHATFTPPGQTTHPAEGALHLAMESQFLLGLRTERLYAAPFSATVHAQGLVVPAPGGQAELRAPTAGVVGTADGGVITPGATVRAGQALLTVRPTLGPVDLAGVRSSEAAARARLSAAERDLVLAERDASRLEALTDALPAREKVARERGLAVATEAVRQARHEVEAFAAGGAALVVRAPLSGRVSALVARPGDAVEAGQPLVRVLGDGAVWVEAQVPEAAAGDLHSGATATVTDAAGHTWTATVLDAGLEIDPATGRARVTLTVEDGAALRPGAGVSVDIHTGAPHDTLSVPDAAVVDSAGVPFVFVKVGPESFALREVLLGPSDGVRREVLHGLAPADRVVAQGTYALRALAGR